MEHEINGYNLMVSKRTEGLGNHRMSGEHSNYSIVEIGQNTEKIPGDLGRLVVTQTPVKEHQLKLMRKILKK